MGNQLKIAGWIWGGVGVLVCWLFGARVMPIGATVVASGALGLGGLGVVLTRRFTLGGRFGGQVIIEGGPALSFGTGLLILAATAPFIALFYAYRAAHPRTVVGLIGIAVGFGLIGVGSGIGGHFVREDWRRRAQAHPVVRLLSAVFMAWAFGFIGFVGVALIVAGVVILLSKLPS